MEKDIALGSVGNVALKIADGVASEAASASYSNSVLGGAIVIKGTVTEEIDVNLASLLTLLKTVAEAKLPPALKPFEEFTFGELTTLVQGLS